MASPLNSFRKNKKAWLACLGVLCMVTFVLVPSTTRVGCGGSPTEEFAVETKVRSVSMGELQDLAQQRERIDAFAYVLDMSRLQAATQAQNKRNPTAQEINALNAQFAGFRPSMSRQVNAQQPYREALDTWLKVQKAKDLGIEVSQKIITEYIKTRSGGALSRQAMDTFLQQHGISEPELYAALGNELVAERVDELYGFGGGTSELSPAECKELWDRQHRRAHVEVVALNVKGFVGLVEEPSDETLKEFFERYRERLPNPESPEPGFRLPYLAQFQYLWVSQPRLYEAAMKAITDAEIAKRYDELVKAKNTLGGKLEFKEEDWKKSLTPTEKEGDKKEGDKKDAGKAAPAKPATDKPATDKSKTDKSKTDAKSGTSGASVVPPDDASRQSAAFPVALAADGDGARETGLTLAQAAPPAKTPEKTAADAKTPPADAKTEKQPEKNKEPAKPGDSPESKSSPLKLLDPFQPQDRRLDEIFSDLTIPEDIRELPPGGKPPEFKPLWAVEATIREELAKDMARADARRLLELIKEPLDKHFKDYERWAKRKKKDAPPANPLEDPANVRKLVDVAWNTFVEGKREAWKKSFEERKKFVDAEIKRLMDEKQLTLEGFKKLATDSKNEDWQKLLEEQQRLTDVDKLAANTLDTWQARLSKKRTNLEPEAAATTPEKKEPAKDEKEAAGAKDKAASQDAPPKKEGGKEPTAETKKPADKQEEKKAEAGKPAESRNAKKADDGTLEPTDPVISLEKTAPGPTGHGLEQRDFRRHKYKLATAQVTENQSSQEFMSGAFERAALFQPTLASASDDQYLFWKISHRPSEVLPWEDSRTHEVVAATRATVLEEYRKYAARELVLKRAQELALQIGQEGRTFPVEEVLRLFRLDGQGGTASPDRQSLSLTGSNTAETYAVTAEIFEEGKRRALDAPSAASDGPLEAPSQTVFGDLEQARQQAMKVAAAQRKPTLLVIVGKAIGQDKNGLVFQGVQGFRWQASEKGASAGDEEQNVVSGPGRLAGTPLPPLKVGSGDNATTVEVVGQRLEPFTWDQVAPLTGRGEDDPGVTGLVVPGEVFGDMVFRLQPGELGAALNQPQTIAYVAQVTGYDYSVLGGVYPADGTLEKSPLRDAFLMACRSAATADEQYSRQAQMYRQFGLQPPPPPASLAFRSIRAVRQYRTWREGLYTEFGVRNDEILDRGER